MDTEFRRLQVREEVINARAFDTVLVNSYFSMESVARTYGIVARVCYLGVNLDDWTPPPSETPGYGLIGVGGFQFSKRIDLVIESVGLLSGPAPPIIWAGYGANEQYLENVVELARSRRVPFTPYLKISHEKLLSLTSAASIYCCTARLEPFGYGPLEAGAARLPVVAVAEGGFRETVVQGVNGLLVDPDPESFAAALQYLLDDEERRQSLGDGGRKLVEERWTVGSAATRLEAELERALARGRKKPAFAPH